MEEKNGGRRGGEEDRLEEGRKEEVDVVKERVGRKV